nr:NUDIX domain-containing protein [Candidatus Woesearchaeota archaeon]
MNKKTVALILPYNNKFEIIMQKRKGFVDKPVEVDYGFFGGHLEEGETVKQALKREIKEELNIDIRDIKSLKFFNKYQYEVKEKEILVELYVFLCKMKDVKNMKVNEGKPATLKLREAINLNISKMDKKILGEVYNFLFKKS